MRVKIIRKNFGGVEFGPEMRVLHLGGQSSANVERLKFELPQEWAGCAVTLHIQRQDGTLPAPILLDEEHSAAVGKEFTASPCGSWMLLALGEDGYRALTRPARYDCYETLNTDGDAEISPTQYELFVARVLGYATGAQESAKEARNAAAAAKQDADTAATAGAWCGGSEQRGLREEHFADRPHPDTDLRRRKHEDHADQGHHGTGKHDRHPARSTWRHRKEYPVDCGRRGCGGKGKR